MFEINVSLNGCHFFATAERSLTTERKAYYVLKEIKQRFPESEGFEISLSTRQFVGQQHDVDAFMKTMEKQEATRRPK